MAKESHTLMKTKLQKLFIFIAGIAIAVPIAAQAQVSTNFWKVVSSILQPVVSTWSLKIPQLGGSGTQCTQVDNNGVFSVSGTGACGAGGGTSASKWATTTNTVSIRPSGGINTGLIIGALATSTQGKFEVWNGTTTLATTTTSQLNGVIVVDGVHYPQTGAGIQAAINALPTTGGTVFLPSATYIVSTPIIISSDYVSLNGAGNSTIIKATVGLNNGIIKVDDAALRHNLSFTNFKVDGDKLDQTSGICIIASSTVASLFDNLWVTSCKDINLKLAGTSVGGYGSANIVSHSRFDNAGTYGIWIETSDENNIHDDTFSDFSKYAVYDNAGTQNIHDNTFVGGLSWTTGVGVYILNTANTRVVHNTFDGMREQSIYSNNSGYLDISNNFMSYIAGSAGTSAIKISGGAYNSTQLNTVSGGAYYTYPYEEVSSPTNSTVANNYFAKGTVGGPLMNNTNTSNLFNNSADFQSNGQNANYWQQLDSVGNWRTNVPTSQNHSFSVNGTVIGSINSVGLGIGSVAVDNPLEVYGSASFGANQDFLLSEETGYKSIQTFSNTPLALNALGNSVGIGTSTPIYKLTVASSTALTDGAGIAQWITRNAGGNLYFSTSTIAGTATTSISALEISGSGFGTTTLRGLNISGQATSTANVGYNITTGCYAISGNCISGSGGSGSGTVNTGPAGYLAYYNTTGTAVSPTSTNPLYVDAIAATSSTATSTFKQVQIGSATFKDNALDINCNRTYSTSQSDGGCLNIRDLTGLNKAGELFVYSSNGSGATARMASFINDNAAFDQELMTIRSASLTRTTLGIEGSSTAQGEVKITHYGGNGQDPNASMISMDAFSTTSPATFSAVQGIFFTSTSGGTTGKILQLKNNLLAFGGADAQVNLLDLTGQGYLSLASSTVTGIRLVVNSVAGDRLAMQVGSTTAPYMTISNSGFGTTTLSGLTISGSATSTSNVGYNITTGCYAISGTCISGSAGGSTNPAGTGSEIQYRAGATSFGAIPLTATVLTGTSAFVGYGTTTPHWLMQLASSTEPQLALSDGSLTSNHWTMRSVGNSFYLATASPTTYATSTTAAFSINKDGVASFPIGLTLPFLSSTKCLDEVNGVIGVAAGGDCGTVTSVGLSLPTGFTVTNSPVTTSGTLTATLGTGYSIAEVPSYTVKAAGGDFTTIQGALDRCGTDGGGSIYLLDASYAQAGTGLTFKGSNCHVIGRGVGTTTITFTGATTGFKTNSAAGKYSNNSIENITMTGDGTAASIAIDISDMSHAVYQHLKIDNFDTVFRWNDTQNTTFYNMIRDTTGTTIGSYGINASSTNPTNDNMVENSFFGCKNATAAGCVGVNLNNAQANSFYNVTVEPAGTSKTIGVQFRSNNLTTNNGTFSNIFYNFYAEGNTYGISASSTANRSGLAPVFGNNFYGGQIETNTTDYACESADCNEIDFHGTGINFVNKNLLDTIGLTSKNHGTMFNIDDEGFSSMAMYAGNTTNFAHNSLDFTKLALVNSTDASNLLNLNNAGTGATIISTTSNFILNSKGNVGVGTTTFLGGSAVTIATTTTQQLNLRGDNSNAGWGFRNIGGFMYIGTTSPSTWATSTTPVMTFATTGPIWIATSTSYAASSTGQLMIASSTGPQLSLWGDGASNTWNFRNAGGNLYFSTTSLVTWASTTISALTINGTTGNVGLGTDAPTQKLDVVGNYILKDAATPTKSLKFATAGSDLDFAGGGRAFYISMWDDAAQTTDQKFYLGFNTADPYVDAYRNWIFHNDIFGAAMFSVRPDNSEVVVNDDSSAYNFRVEGDTDANLIFGRGTGDFVGIGTSTPQWKLTIASTTQPQLALVGNATDNAWVMRSIGGNFYMATASPTTWATTSPSALTLIGTSTTGSIPGAVGIASTTPWGLFSINPNATGSTAPLFVVGSSTLTLVDIDAGGHLVFGGHAQPALSSCGGSPTLQEGNDSTGIIKVGGGTVTSCTLTFNNTFANSNASLVPVCMVQMATSTASTLSASTTSTTLKITTSAATMGGLWVNYHCFGNLK